MLTREDHALLESKGILPDQVYDELRQLRDGFPLLRLSGAATLGNGILSVDEHTAEGYKRTWASYRESHKAVKFVPASGAASRMFKDLHEFLHGESRYPRTASQMSFFNYLRNFAFYDELNDTCLKHFGSDTLRLLVASDYKKIVHALLDEEAMGYGVLPKGALLFHRSQKGVRTPFEEHLAEAALYCKNKDGVAHVHFTVSPEHRALFERLLLVVGQPLMDQYHTQFEVSFSEQKPSTDTVAMTPQGDLFRKADNQMLLRPGGHGSLIENLNELDADLVFIKNIDNVQPEGHKEPTVELAETMAGLAVSLQEQSFYYLRRLEEGAVSQTELDMMLHFLVTDLCQSVPADRRYEKGELQHYIFHKLNRPLRVCAMVPREGEPGGGPYWAYNADGSVSLQILESVQINMDDDFSREIVENSTHFNPVNLVCALKDYKGRPFDLTKHVDVKTGFISEKSYEGRPLFALERPGLWNGAMSDWNTVFIEADPSTFTPVKTVVDLLRPEHQA